MKTRIKVVTQGDTVTYWPQVKRWWGWTSILAAVTIEGKWIYCTRCLEDAQYVILDRIRRDTRRPPPITTEYINYP